MIWTFNFNFKFSKENRSFVRSRDEILQCSVAAELRCAQLRSRKMSQTYVRFTENDEFGTVARRWWNYENFDEQTERLNLYDFRNYAFDLVF